MHPSGKSWICHWLCIMSFIILEFCRSRKVGTPRELPLIVYYVFIMLEFFNLIFGGHESFLWDHWYPCFGLLVMSPLGFKARVSSLICAWQRDMSYTFPEIHLWCDTFACVYGQYSGWLFSPHACFSRGKLPDSNGRPAKQSDMLTTQPQRTATDCVSCFHHTRILLVQKSGNPELGSYWRVFREFLYSRQFTTGFRHLFCHFENEVLFTLY